MKQKKKKFTFIFINLHVSKAQNCDIIVSSKGGKRKQARYIKIVIVGIPTKACSLKT